MATNQELSLQQLKKYKNEILRHLVQDVPLSKAVKNNQEDFLLHDIVFEEGEDGLEYTHIFPYKFAGSQLTTEEKTYITMDMSINRQGDWDGGHEYYHYTIVFYIITHKDLMRVKVGNEYELRPDFIMSRIETILKNKIFGMGRLKLSQSGTLFFTSNFPCYYVAYETTDFSGRRSDLASVRENVER